MVDTVTGLTLLAPLSIPSPPTGTWYLGPFPVRAYALCILAGIVAAYFMARARWRARGGNPDSVDSVAIVAVPLGIVGARLYHVITDYQLYFGPGREWWRMFYIWEGGLGVWGAVALGALGGWLVCRRRGISFLAMADTMAPGIILAQGIGRLGNWFNQELFGKPTTLPWALEIDPAHRPAGYEQYATFHPTFLYELLWCVLVCLALLWADRRFRLGHGKVFGLYVALYTLGRFFIEALRIDSVNQVQGFRLNNYTSLIVFVLAVLWLVWLLRSRPGRETEVDASVTAEATGEPDSDEDGDEDAADAHGAGGDDPDTAAGGTGADQPDAEATGAGRRLAEGTAEKGPQSRP